MPNYRAQNIQHKTTSTGKPYISATLIDSEGNEHERVSIWSDFPGFHGITEGSTIMGDLVSNGKFKNLKPTRGGGSAYSAPRSPAYGVKAAQERKGEMINKAQEAKEIGIKLSGAMRDATLITLASLKDQPFPDDDDFMAAWKKWRDFLMTQFDDKKDSEDIGF